MQGLAFIVVLALGVNPDAEAARADRVKFPQAEWGYLTYFTTSSVDNVNRPLVESQLKFVCASLSSKVDLAKQLPVQVSDTVWRIDARDPGWGSVLWRELVKFYPYYRYHENRHYPPLLVDALWFVANALDDVETPGMQYQLLYSGRPPLTEAEYLKFWGIQNDPQFVFGLIEAQSGVAVQKVRLVESRPGAKRNSGWVTRDSSKIAGKTDPLENLPNKAKYEASELITTMPKSYAGESGKLLTFFLADANGKRQAKAPTNIVVDHTNTRGVEIRNSSSCIYCHLEGIRPPTENAFRAYLESGARVYADKKQKEAIDLYFVSDVNKEIERDNEDYSAALDLINGLNPTLNAKTFAHCVKLYDADVTLESAARMFYTTPEELQLAMAEYAGRYRVSGRFTLLAQGEPISRDAFKENFYTIQEAVYQWQK
jgi:hypothetical protein